VLGKRDRGSMEVGLTVFAESLLQTRYDTYQCPACGAEVIFMRSEDSRIATCRRLWDSVSGQ